MSEKAKSKIFDRHYYVDDGDRDEDQDEIEIGRNRTDLPQNETEILYPNIKIYSDYGDDGLNHHHHNDTFVTHQLEQTSDEFPAENLVDLMVHHELTFDETIQRKPVRRFKNIHRSKVRYSQIDGQVKSHDELFDISPILSADADSSQDELNRNYYLSTLSNDNDDNDDILTNDSLYSSNSIGASKSFSSLNEYLKDLSLKKNKKKH